MTRQAPRISHFRLVRKLVLVSVGMFGFGFLMWPLYNVFCDLTGLGGRGVKIAEEAGELEKSDRQVRIRFDATTNSSLRSIRSSRISAMASGSSTGEVTAAAPRSGRMPTSVPTVPVPHAAASRAAMAAPISSN